MWRLPLLIAAAATQPASCLCVRPSPGGRWHVSTAVRQRAVPTLVRASGSEPAAEDEPPGDGASQHDAEQGRRRRGLGVWNRLRRRVVDKDSTKQEDTEPLLEGVAKDIDLAIALRRRRLNANLGTSLRTFREEVLSEVEQQALEAKERQQRLKERQNDISVSLDAMRQVWRSAPAAVPPHRRSAAPPLRRAPPRRPAPLRRSVAAMERGYSDGPA